MQRAMIGGTMLLAGDIGGTKTALAVFSPARGPRAPLAHAQFASADFPDLSTIVREFLTQVRLPIRAGTNVGDTRGNRPS